MTRNRNHALLGVYTIGIAALFLLGFLLLVVFGAGSYRDTVDTQEVNGDLRVQLAYISTACQQAGPGHIRVEDGVEGPMLVLSDDETDYVTRIYLADGALTEEYRKAQTTPDPAQGRTISRTSVFTVNEIRPGLLAVRTDAGLMMVRTGEEAADE